MNFEQQNTFGNADIAAATGLSATTIQTWANRGILALSGMQRNPGIGQKRLYSGLDIARIAAMKALIDRGVSASAAGQIALRLERSPQTAGGWRRALEESAPHIHVFVNGGDVAMIYVGSDARELAKMKEIVNEPDEGARERLHALHLEEIRLGNGQRDRMLSGLSKIPEWDGRIAAISAEIAALTTKTAIFDIGPEVFAAGEKLKILERERAGRSYSLWFIPVTVNGQVSVRAEGRPVFGGGKIWRKSFATVGDFVSGIANAWPLPAGQLGVIRNSLSSGETVQLSWGGDRLSVAEGTLISLGMVEE
jgi:DNA-binding transcriptional MerR regulator